MTLTVGNALQAAIVSNGDRPILGGRAQDFFKNGDGSQGEIAWGLKGQYIASNASGQWEVAGPFGGAA